MDIVLATKNRGKVREYTPWLEKLGFNVLSLCDYPEIGPIEESGSSFEENAEIKALEVSKWIAGALVLSDDSGLCVPALAGAPGIYSARYAGQGASDLDNRKKLLAELVPYEGEARAAYFECAISIAMDGRLVKTAIGRCEGQIADRERGGSGFGYDALFIKNGYGKTFAELGDHLKAEVSHRKRAIDKLIDTLEQRKFI
jgi:XTP/dITP diphosphohydrolase